MDTEKSKQKSLKEIKHFNITATSEDVTGNMIKQTLPLKLLKARVASLEEQIFGVNNHDLIRKQLTRGKEPFYKRLETLQEDANNKFQESFIRFLTKYKESPVYIESPNYISPSSLTVEEKLELLKVGHDDLSKTISCFETIDKLKNYINNDDTFQNINKHGDKLKQLEYNFIDILRRSQHVHQRVGILTEKYDNIINILCEKMLVWNDFIKQQRGDDATHTAVSTTTAVSEQNDNELSTNANDYESMKYADLRSLCKERGIKASGKKIDLIQKLKDADTAQGTA